jgi:hypothetical protein
MTCSGRNHLSSTCCCYETRSFWLLWWSSQYIRIMWPGYLCYIDGCGDPHCMFCHSWLFYMIETSILLMLIVFCGPDLSETPSFFNIGPVPYHTVVNPLSLTHRLGDKFPVNILMRQLRQIILALFHFPLDVWIISQGHHTVFYGTRLTTHFCSLSSYLWLISYSFWPYFLRNCGCCKIHLLIFYETLR